MDEVFKDPVQLTKGINLRDLLAEKSSEFHIDLDFKKKSGGTMLNADDDLFPDFGDEEDDSDSEDVLKNIEESTDKMMLASPEYHSFEDLAAKMVDCVASGDVKILIIEEGDGPLVPVDAEVTIHYAAYWEKAKIPFDSTLTMNCGAPTKLRLGVGKILPGLELGLTTVRGPTARLQLLLQPRAAWGLQGAPPRIRPEPALFVIVLYAVRDDRAAVTFNDLPSDVQSKFETTLKTVTVLHTQAKEHFKKKKYVAAIKNYQQSTSVLKLSKPQTEIEENQIKQLKLNAYMNLAVCYYKIQKPKHVIYMLQSLENYNIVNTDNHCKSLFYYGRAYEALGKTEKAIKFYERALKLEPKNKDIGKALDNIDGYIKQSGKKEKEMWQKVFKSEKKVIADVDEDFQNGVREMFEQLAGSDEYAIFDLPTGLTKNEVDCVKSLANDFKGLVVREEGEGRKKKVTIVKKLL